MHCIDDDLTSFRKASCENNIKNRSFNFHSIRLIMNMSQYSCGMVLFDWLQFSANMLDIHAEIWDEIKAVVSAYTSKMHLLIQ